MNFKYTDEAFLQEFEKIINLLKQGQAEPAVPPNPYAAMNPEIISNIAKKLVNRLKQETGITKDQNNGQNEDLYVRDLQDLNSLILFLRLEGIQSDGQFIVVSGQTNIDPKLYAEYTLATGRAGTPVNEKVFINKNGIINYLKGLQRQAAQEPNELLAAMVGRLIDDANKQLQLNITPDQTKEKQNQQSATIPDDVPLDHISDPILLDNPLISNGNVLVSPANLKSPANFSAFIKNLKLKVKDKITSYEEFTDRNFCDVISFLWARANSKYYRSKDHIDKYYVELVSKLSESYSCNLEGNSTNNSDKAKPSNYKNVSWKPGEPLTPEAQQALAPISMRYPLLNDRIDLRWITEWVVAYQNVMKKLGHAPEEASQNVIDTANSIMTAYGFTSQNLNATAINIYRQIRGIAISRLHKSPQEAIYVPMGYVQQLNQLITSLGLVLQSFKRDFYDSFPEDWKPLFDRQIDDTTGSLYAINLRKIEEWISMMNNAKVQAEKEM